MDDYHWGKKEAGSGRLLEPTKALERCEWGLKGVSETLGWERDRMRYNPIPSVILRQQRSRS